MVRIQTYLVGVLFVTAAFLIAVAAQGAGSSQGEELFQEKCAICHGADGKGNGPAAAAFGKHPADFTKPSFWQGNVDQKISDTIRNGHPPMPAFSLPPEEIQAIIKYMKQSFEK